MLKRDKDLLFSEKNISDIFLFIMEQATYENMKREIEEGQLYVEKKYPAIIK